MKRQTIFLILLLMLTPALSLAGTAYYVDPKAPLGGNGSYESPWNNINQVNAKAFSTGDDLYFKIGTSLTLTSPLTIDWTGTANDRVIIGAYYGKGQFGLNGSERPILDGNNWTVPGNESGMISSTNQNGWITVQNLYIRHPGGYGIALGYAYTPEGRYTQYNEVKNCIVYRPWRQGILFGRASYGLIEDNYVFESSYGRLATGAIVRGAGIEITGMDSELLSRYNVVRRNEVRRGFEGIGNYKGARYTLIEDNTVYDCQTYNIYVSRSRTATIRNNLVYGTKEKRSSDGGAAIAFDCEYNPEHAPMAIGENTIYKNYIASLGTGILLINNAVGHGVYHNKNKIFDNRVVNCTQNFAIRHDDELWHDNLIENNFSFIFSSGFVHVVNTSPKGVIWNKNHYNTVINNVDGNANRSAFWNEVDLIKKSGWDSLTPGVIDKSYFDFKDGEMAISDESAIATPSRLRIF